MDFLTKFKLSTTSMVLLRYGSAIIGTVLVTSGIVTQDQVNTVTTGVTNIVEGVQIIGGGLAVVIPVAIALWKHWFKPALPVKEMSAPVKEAAIKDVKQSVQAKKKRTTIFGF